MMPYPECPMHGLSIKVPYFSMKCHSPRLVSLFVAGKNGASFFMPFNILYLLHLLDRLRTLLLILFISNKSNRI